MTVLVARARIELTGAQSIVAPLCEHLVGHGARVSHGEHETVITHGSAAGILIASDDHLLARVEAPDLAALQEMRQAIASHVIEFARQDPVPKIVWQGDGSALATPPDFRLLTVIDVRDLTPRMRRISFRGSDLARFDRLDALHVRLFFPPPGIAPPVWPVLGEDGLTRPPPEGQRPAIRKYTIRTIDVAAQTLAIDFVRHGDVGPGTSFASRARIGDQIGMAGPGGRGLRDADWYLFLADETGLPAIARMLERLPATAAGLVALEVSDRGEEQKLSSPPGFEIRWLRRDDVAAGARSRLVDALDEVAWPSEPRRIYLWAAMEFEAFKAVRAAARLRFRPKSNEHLVVSYWRRGLSEEEHGREKPPTNRRGAQAVVASTRSPRR